MHLQTVRRSIPLVQQLPKLLQQPQLLPHTLALAPNAQLYGCDPIPFASVTPGTFAVKAQTPMPGSQRLLPTSPKRRSAILS